MNDTFTNIALTHYSIQSCQQKIHTLINWTRKRDALFLARDLEWAELTTKASSIKPTEFHCYTGFYEHVWNNNLQMNVCQRSLVCKSVLEGHMHRIGTRYLDTRKYLVKL